MKTMFSADNNFTAVSFRPMGPALGCAPCEAMKRKKEAEEEFQRRFGMVNTAIPAQQVQTPTQRPGVAYG